MKDISIRLNLEPPALNINQGNRGIDADKESVSFVDILRNSIQDVNRLHEEADIASKKLAVGKTDNIHDVAIAIEKADISFRLMVQIRNKMLEAYQEVMRLQI